MKREGYISWLQISDLHLYQTTVGNLIKEDIITKFKDNVDFVLVTGDLHNFGEDYNDTLDYLNDLIKELGIEKKDVFIVPGNHDVNKDMNKGYIKDIDKNIEDNEEFYRNYLEEIYNSFSDYQRFIDDFYGSEYSPYEKSAGEVVFQVWNEKIGILQLNTALISDENHDKEQIVDIYRIEYLSKRIRETKLPIIVMGHHDFYNFSLSQRPILIRILSKINARVYMSGHIHRETKLKIELFGTEEKTINNIVSGKLAYQPGDLWSDTGLIYYECDLSHSEWEVTVRPYKWNRNNPRLEPSKTFEKDSETVHSEDNDNLKLRFYLKEGTKKLSISKEAECFTLKPTRPNADFFQYRNTDINEICNYLYSGKNVVLINGVGGVGKTAVAREMFYRLRRNYKNIGWIEYNDTLEKSLLNSIWLFEEEKEEERIKLIKSYLFQLKADTLLFIDNVDKSKLEDNSLKWLEQTDARLILTSRMINLPPFYKYEIGFLSKEECEEIFYCYYGFEKKNEQQSCYVQKLVEMVQCHTLSVELLAKIAREYGLKELYEDLLEKGFAYPSLKVVTDHDDTTFSIDSEKTIAEHLIKLFELIKLSDEQIRILKNIMIMPSIEIPRKVKDWISCDINDLKKLSELGWISTTENGYIMLDIIRKAIELQTSHLNLDDYIKFIEYIICSYDYVKETDNYTLAMSRIIIVNAYIEKLEQNIIDENVIILLLGLYERVSSFYFLKQDYNKAEEYCNRILKIMPKRFGEKYLSSRKIYNRLGSICLLKGDYDKAERYYKKVLKEKEEKSDKNHLNMGDSYNELAIVYQAKGNYNKAKKYYNKALEIAENVFSEKNDKVMIIYSNLAGVYQAERDYDKAKEYYNKALRIAEELFGKEDLATADIVNGLAILYQVDREYDRAEEYHIRALRIREKILGEKDPSVVEIYSSLIRVYGIEGKYDKVEECYSKALGIAKEIFGEENLSMATIYNNFAIACKMKGDYDKAEKYYKKALKVKKKVFSGENLDIVTIYNSLGKIYIEKEEYDKAEEYCNKALKIGESISENECLDTIYDELGKIYLRKKDYAKAEEYYKESLEIKERILGTENIEITILYSDMGILYHKMENYDKAIEYYKKALKIREKILGKEELDIVVIYNHLVKAYIEIGDYDEAIEYCNKSLKIKIEELGEENSDIVIIYNYLAEVYKKKKDYDKAKKYYAKVVKIREKLLGEKHPKIIISYNNLAGIYQNKGEYDKAEEYYTRALKIAEENLEYKHPYTAGSYNNLARIYQNKGEYDKAEEYYTRALKIAEEVLGKEHKNTKIVRKNLDILNQLKSQYYENNI